MMKKTAKRTLVFFLAILPICAPVAQSFWSQPEQLGTASNFSDMTVLEVAGHPAICYEDYPPGRIMFMRALDECGQTWGAPVDVGSFHSYAYGFSPYMTIVNGHPAISYYNPNTQELTYVRSDDIYGNSWSNFKVVDTNGNVGQEAKIKVINGHPAIAYIDLTSSCDQKIKYVRANDPNGDTWGTPVTIQSGLCACCERTKFEVVNGRPALMFGTNVKYVRANDANGDSWPSPATIVTGAYPMELAVIDGLPTALLYLNTDSMGVMVAGDADGATWGSIDTLNLNQAVLTKASLRVVNDTVRVIYSNYVSNATLWQLESPASHPLSFAEPDSIFNPVFYNRDSDLAGEYCGTTIVFFINAGYLYVTRRDATPCAGAPVINTPGVVQPDCVEPSGTITVDASGSGVLEYSLGISDFQASPVFSSLAPGNYNIYARRQDDPSCYTKYSGGPVVINAVPVPPVVNTPTVTQPTCWTPTGQIVVNSTGSGTREFSIDGGDTWQTSNTFPSLAPGSYEIVVRLQAIPACTTAFSGNPVTINMAPVPPVVTDPTVMHPSCVVSTGTIVVNASGNGTIQYSINGGISYSLSPVFPSQPAGINRNIKVRLQAQPTCTAVYSGNPVTINPVPSPPVLNAVIVTQPNCAMPGGSITVNASGNGALEYSSDGGMSYQTSDSFTSLEAGSYNIKVRLQGDTTCVKTYVNNPIVIHSAGEAPVMNPPAVIQPVDCIALTGTIIFDASGSGPLEYSVNNGNSWQVSDTFPNLSLGDYQLLVRLQDDTICLASYTGNPVSIVAPPGCCPEPTYANACNSGDYIDGFTFDSFTNLNTACANPGTGNRSNYSGTGPSVQINGSYAVNLWAGPKAQYFGVYIDFNQNGDYSDPGEFFDIGQAAAYASTTAAVPIPSTALTGTSTMRVRSSYDAPLTAADGCATSLNFGEIEDYDIYIFCPDLLVVDSSPVQSGTYEADVEITSPGFIENGASVVFQAGESIELTGGFEVQAGAFFEIVMQGCFP